MGILVVVISWCFFAFLVGMFWKSRGRDQKSGILWSLIFSPLIAFLIALFIPPNYSNQENNKMKASNLKKCPECAELIRAEAKICRFCRYEFKEEPSAVDNSGHAGGIIQTQPLTLKERKEIYNKGICPECNSEIDVALTKCLTCGADLSPLFD